jgi:hypothetical protein
MPLKSNKGNRSGKDSNPSQRRFPQVETWGQAVVQDGESADHGIMLFPVIFFMYK